MKKTKIIVASLFLLLFAAVCNAAPMTVKFIRIGSASMGGNVYIQGNALAQLINEKMDGVKASNQETNGSVENIIFLDEKEVEFALVMGATLQQAVDGTGSFKGHKVNTLNLMGLVKFDTYHVYVYKGAGITSIPGLKGKKIGVGPMGGGVQVNANALLSGYGITTKDYTPMYGTVSDMYEQLKTGQIDALIHCATAGTSQPSDALASGKVALLPIPKADAERIIRQNRSFSPYVLKANLYADQPEAINTIASTNVMICRKDLDAEFVYRFMKLFYENNAYLQTFHATFAQSKPEDATTAQLIPLHPGAARYLKEIGALK